MQYWAVVVPAERYEAERLFHHETLDLTGLEPPTYRAHGPSPGDPVLLVAATDPPVVFGLARVRSSTPLVLSYTRRGLDAPQPVETALGGALGDAGLGVLRGLDEATYTALAAQIPPPAPRRPWLVSVDLPIEAESPAEAVREFWTYLVRLGPRELPAFVSPSGDELAMQAYVLGELTNLDPEEDEDE
ncbi:MAG: hypothetical protein FWJ93_00840 [Micromonosporaceae bacterium]